MSAALTAFAVRYNVATVDAYVLPALFERTAQKLGRAPDSDRYTKNFLVVAPGLIVYDRLLDAFMGKERDGKRKSAGRGFV